MKLRTVILFALAFFMIAPSFSQSGELSKDEAKYWKNQAKEYKRNPAALKALAEEHGRYMKEAQQLQAQLRSVEAGQSQEKSRLSQLEQENTQLRRQLGSAEQTIQQMSRQIEQMSSTKPAPPSTTTPGANTGVVFRVQIGAFSTGRIPQSVQSIPDKMIEQDGGLQKVLVGNYQNYNDAKARASQLKSQGFDSPWVVPYKDGRRVSLEEALGN